MKTVINIKTDKETKEKAQKLAEDLGVNLSVLVNACLRQAIQKRAITIVADETPSPWLEKVLEQAEKDIATGKNLSPTFDNAKDAIAWLEKPENEREYS